MNKKSDKIILAAGIVSILMLAFVTTRAISGVDTPRRPAQSEPVKRAS